MLDLNVKAIDIKASAEGNWFKYEGGVGFLIAMNGNPAHSVAMRKMIEKAGGLEALGAMDEEEAGNLLVPIQAAHILLGWQGLTNGGVEFEANIENRTALLQDPQYDELRSWIILKSKDAENYRLEAVKKQLAG